MLNLFKVLKQDPSQRRTGEAILAKITALTLVQFINKFIFERPINNIKNTNNLIAPNGFH